jgi:hypothetical protein
VSGWPGEWQRQQNNFIGHSKMNEKFSSIKVKEGKRANSGR